jgi:hypothetical protein
LNSRSGGGSNLGVATATSLRFLADVIREFNVSSMIDAPCGDFNWQNHAWEVDSISAYLGLDIAASVVHQNNL